MTDYRVLLTDELTGNNIAELPFTFEQPYTLGLTSVGECVGSIPLDHPAADPANFIDKLASITVIADNVPDWNGLVLNPEPDLDARVLNLHAYEASIWMWLRTIEVDKHYNADMYSIVRKLWTYITTKTDGGSINASIPRFTVASGLSGVTKRLVLAGSARHFMADAVQFLVDDPDTGLEWRMNYKPAGSTRVSCQRVLELGNPLGSTLTTVLSGALLSDYGKVPDWRRAATRAHTVGAGFTATKQNTGSIAGGIPLLEQVDDLSDTADHDRLNDHAREMRRKLQPPVKTYSASFKPNPNGLRRDFCSVGDTVPFDVNAPSMLQISAASRRVVEIGTMPPSDRNDEEVFLTFNLPADELGA